MTLSNEERFSGTSVDPDLKRTHDLVNTLRSSVQNPSANIGLLFEQLNKLYDTPKVPVRFKIVYELSAVPRPESVDFLKRALADDKSPLVRHEAAMALDGVGDETALSKLREHLADKDPIVTASCEVAISSILSRKTS